MAKGEFRNLNSWPTSSDIWKNIPERAEKCKGIDMCDPKYRNSEIDLKEGKAIFEIVIVQDMLWNNLTSIIK